MKITKLEYQNKDPNRVNVYIDDNFTAGLDVNDIIRLGLFNGQEISKEQVNKIISESEFGKLFNAALNFLSFRPRSEWEIRQYLKRKVKKNLDFRHSGKYLKSTHPKSLNVETVGDSKRAMTDDKQIEKVISKLKTLGQVNDLEFTRWLIDQRRTFKPQGQRALKYELAKKGVPRSAIAHVLEEKRDESPSEQSLANLALNRKFRKLPVPRNPDQKKKLRIKLCQFLASRGFGWEISKETVDKFLGKEYNDY